MIESHRDFYKTIDPEHSLSFDGVGRNKTITESVRLENGPKFSCFSQVQPRGIKSREKDVKLVLFFQDDKTSAPYVFPRPHFETSLVMVSYYGYEI